MKRTCDDNLTERRLLRKLDLTILPLSALLFLVLTMDKIATGNAKIAGLEHDLGMMGWDYNIGLSLFYICYCGFPIPSNIALGYVGPSWIAFIVISSGLVTLSSAFIHNHTGFIVTRIMLGISESGLIPGIAYLLSLYYPRSELALRVSTFLFVGGAFAGAFGGFFAYGLLSIGSIGSVASWRKIFLVEGIITTTVGLLCLFFIPDHPEKSTLLTEVERELVLKRNATDNLTSADNSSQASSPKRFRPRLILRSFTFTTAICALSHFVANMSIQGLSIFLPTIIKGLGNFSTVEAQLRTVPPYILALLCAAVNAYISYRLRQRGICIAIGTLFTIIGYATFVGSNDSHVRYAACFLALAGTQSMSPMLISWVTENVAPDAIRAVSTAIVIEIGSLGSLASAWLYLPRDAPKYRFAHSVNLVAAVIALILTIIGIFYVHWENGKRSRGERDDRLSEKSQVEINELGSQHPNYRYQP